MFSGLVTAVGRVVRIRPARIGGLDLDLAGPYRGMTLGESVAVDGACLTVARKVRGGFGVHVVVTTIERTLFGQARVGQRVNLERALRVGDRLGGHWVQGHVDGIATVRATRWTGDAWLVDLVVPRAVALVSVPLGSITVSGVSLTVNAKGPGRRVQVSLVPHTLEHTTLGNLQRTDRVHVEGDLIGKYVAALVARDGTARA